MPKKTKKGKKKGKAKGQSVDEKLEMVKQTKELLKSYTTRCTSCESTAGLYIVKNLKQCIEDEKPLFKAILDQSAPERKAKGQKSKTSVATSTSTATSTSLSIGSVSTQPPVLLKPLLYSLTTVKYTHIRCLHIWHIKLSEEDLVSLALFMVNPVGSQIRVLDLTGTNVTMWGIQRLSRTLSTSQLVHLTLDYNRLTKESVSVLCDNLENCLTLNSLNMNYCHLTAECGDLLGSLATSTQLRYLGIQGNYLQSKGFAKFLSYLATVSESNESMPLLAKVFLQDNAIDGCGPLAGEDGIFAPVFCMQVMTKWIINCKNIEEIRLEGNLIGDPAAREILLSLHQRKEVGLPAIKLGLTNKISSEVFTGIMDLTGTGGKKKGKGKKKKGKKK